MISPHHHFIHGRKVNYKTLPEILQGISFLDDIYIGHINKLSNIQECHGYANFINANITTFQGIGKEYFKVIDNSMTINTAIRSNILGLLLVKKLNKIIVSEKIKYSRCTGIVEPFTIVDNHLSLERDVLECQEELITKKYRHFAKF
jgi:hypothetical protein